MTRPAPVRPAAVAGRFYPARAPEIRALLAELSAPPQLPPVPVRALLVPHAGHVYSGRTALLTYRAAQLPDTFVILCPNHTGRGETFAIQSSGAWETPLGRVPIAEELGAALLAGSTLLVEDGAAHEQEHAIEVQLPMLQLLKEGAAAIVPICVGTLDRTLLERLGAEIAAVLAGFRPEPLVVISSDMTHYEPAAAAAVKDRLAIERLEAVDARGLHDVVRTRRISMCGIAPAVASLAAITALGARSGELVDYSHSGQRTGDDGSVVGYAGLRFV